MEEEHICSQCGVLGTLDCGGCGEVYYCSRDHQRQHWSMHKKDCRSYKIASAEGMGEYLVASRAMNPGYLFLSDEPLIEGPLSTSAPVCLGCHGFINDQDMFYCPTCTWPMCSERCSTSFLHSKECEILSRDVKKIGVPQNFNETPRYDIITVLRGLLTKYHDLNSWKILISMESHSKLRERSKESHHVATVRYLLEVLKVDFEEAAVHHIRGAIVTNGMEIRSSEGSKIRAVYPRIRLLNHSCIPNVHLSSTKVGIMEARSAVRIEKGEPLYICYTGTVEPLWTRQSSARETYNFECGCDRCADPTELGTYFSSPRCPDCIGKYLLPTKNKKKPRWMCLCCELEYTLMDITQEVEEWLLRLSMKDMFQSGSPKHVMNAVANAESSFHSKHYVVLRTAHTGISMLISDPSLQSLNVRRQLWRKILDIYDVLEPGLTRRRAMTMFELGRVTLNYIKSSQEENDITSAYSQQLREEAVKYLQAAGEIFRLEPKGTPEAVLFTKAYELLHQGGLRLSNFGLRQNVCAVCDTEGGRRCGGCGEVYYCSREHQRSHWALHKVSCRMYGETWSDSSGRYLKSIRQIQPGELVVSEEPICLGPKSISDLICLGCHKSLAGDSITRCPQCRWPVCTVQCIYDQSSHHSREECKILSKDTKNIGVPVEFGETPRYDIILVLRACLLQYKNHKLWKRLLLMESHWENHKEEDDPYHMATLKYLTDVCRLDIEMDILHQVRGAILTNCYETRSKSGTIIRGIYPLLGRLNHSCLPNVTMISDETNTMKVRAASLIEANTPLHVSYIGTTEPLWERQYYTQKIHYFKCNCIRCMDSTEFGTHFSSIKCTLCKSIMNLEKSELNTTWICRPCNTILLYEDINNRINRWISVCEKWSEDKTSAREIENVLDQISREYNQRNFLWMKVGQDALRILRNNKDIDSLILKANVWNTISQLVNIFEPGATVRRAITLYEATSSKLTLCLAFYKASLIKQEKVREDLLVVEDCLKEVIRILQLQTPGEGQTNSWLTKAKNDLKNVQSYFDNLI